MKIVQICPFFYPVVGGMEEHVFQISKYLSENGHDVKILTQDRDREGNILPRESKIGNLTVKRFRNIFSLGEFGKIWPGFLTYLKSENPDVVHVHAYRHPHTDITVFLKKTKQIKSKLFLTTHNPFHQNTGKIRRLMTFFYDNFQARLLLRSFSKIFIVSKQERFFFEKFVGSDHIEWLPNGVLKVFFDKVNPKLKKEIGVYDKKIVLWVGRIHPVKNLPFFSKVVEKITSQRKDTIFVFIGPGDIPREYQNKNFKEKVFFIGGRKTLELPAYYADVDIFVLPSLFEGQPLVLLEAMANGLPIIATNMGGSKDFVNESTGFLCSPHDSEKWVEKINYLIENPTSRKTLGNNAKILAGYFTWDKIAKKIEENYEKSN